MKSLFSIVTIFLGLTLTAQDFNFPMSQDARTSIAYYYWDKAIRDPGQPHNSSVMAQFVGDKLVIFTPTSITAWDTRSGKQLNQLVLDRLRKDYRSYVHFTSFQKEGKLENVYFQPEAPYSSFPFTTTNLPDTLINFDPDQYNNVYVENLDNQHIHFWHKAGDHIRDYFYDTEANRFYFHRNEWARPFTFARIRNGGFFRYDEINKNEPTAVHLFTSENKAGSDIYFADFTLVFYGMEMYFYDDESRWLTRYTDGTGLFRGIRLPSIKPITLPHTKKTGYYLWNSAFEFPHVWAVYGSAGNDKDPKTDIQFVEVNLLTNTIERSKAFNFREPYNPASDHFLEYKNVWHILASLYADSLRKNPVIDTRTLNLSIANGSISLDATNNYSLSNPLLGKISVNLSENQHYQLNLQADQALLHLTVNATGDKMAIVIGKKSISTAMKNTNRRFYYYDTYYYLVDLKTGTVNILKDELKYQEQIKQLTTSIKPFGAYFNPYTY